MQLTLEMFGSRFSVRPWETPEDERSAGGIVIPTTVDVTKNAQGTVVSVGDGLLLQDGNRVPLPVKVGDHVLYRKHAGAEVKVGSETLVVLDLENLLGVLKP